MSTTITPAPMIYASLFGTPNPDQSTLDGYLNSASDLSGSGFTTVNLWQFHVDPAGDLLVNAAAPSPALISQGALQSDFSYVPQVLGTLTGQDSSVTTVRATIGGWGLDDTFNNIVALFNQYGTTAANPLYGNFAALQALGVDGIDLDLEPGGGATEYDYPYYIGPLAQLITMAASLGLDTTFCPYQNENFWLTLLAAVYTQNGVQQPVKSMNVQCYSGGNANTQTQWIDAMQAWPSLGINLLPNPFGIAEADYPAFVVPGFGVMNGSTPLCPPAFTTALKAQGFAQSGITGAYLFNYANIQFIQGQGSCSASATQAFATALIDGINDVNAED